MAFMDNMGNKLYILSAYRFYDDNYILMISQDYSKVKKQFDEIKKEKGYGYIIEEYDLDTPYKMMDEHIRTLANVEIDYDNTRRDLMVG